LLSTAIVGLNLGSRDVTGAWMCQLCFIHSKLQGCSNNNKKKAKSRCQLGLQNLFLCRRRHRRGNEHLHSLCLLNCPSLFLSCPFLPSSEGESDFNGNSSSSEVGEGQTSLLEPPTCPSPPRRWTLLARSPMAPEESHRASKVMDGKWHLPHLGS